MGSLKLRPTYRKLINHGWATSSVINLPIVVHHPHLEKTVFFLFLMTKKVDRTCPLVYGKKHTRELSQDKTSLSRASIYFVSGDCEVSGWSERTGTGMFVVQSRTGVQGVLPPKPTAFWLMRPRRRMICPWCADYRASYFFFWSLGVRRLSISLWDVSVLSCS